MQQLRRDVADGLAQERLLVARGGRRARRCDMSSARMTSAACSPISSFRPSTSCTWASRIGASSCHQPAELRERRRVAAHVADLRDAAGVARRRRRWRRPRAASGRAASRPARACPAAARRSPPRRGRRAGRPRAPRRRRRGRTTSRWSVAWNGDTPSGPPTPDATRALTSATAVTRNRSPSSRRLGRCMICVASPQPTTPSRTVIRSPFPAPSRAVLLSAPRPPDVRRRTLNRGVRRICNSRCDLPGSGSRRDGNRGCFHRRGGLSWRRDRALASLRRHGGGRRPRGRARPRRRASGSRTTTGGATSTARPASGTPTSATAAARSPTPSPRRWRELETFHVFGDLANRPALDLADRLAASRRSPARASSSPPAAARRSRPRSSSPGSTTPSAASRRGRT